MWRTNTLHAGRQQGTRDPLKIVHTSATSSEASVLSWTCKGHLLACVFGENDLLRPNYRFTPPWTRIATRGVRGGQRGRARVDSAAGKEVRQL